MKNQILLLFLILFTLSSCSPTINKSLYSKSDNAKKLILLEYGNPSNVENKEEKEIWIYDYSSQFKSNRTVVFNKYGKIISNKKHYKVFHMITGVNRDGYIWGGIVIALAIIFGPFPALL